MIPLKLNSTRWRVLVSGRRDISVTLVVVVKESDASGVLTVSGRFANGARRRDDAHFTALVPGKNDSMVSVLPASSQ